ncbi:MAG: hypothetical protein PSV36_10250 [Algoriphagus sp.]|nr:hypothetical protein [Algoriphagus sp.]
MNLKKNILENLILPLGDIILGSNFISKLKQWRKILSKNHSELDRIQLEKLHALLVHATTNSPYYRLQNIERKSDPIAWLKSFPVLSKRSFRDSLEFIVTKPIDKNLVVVMSSGSTGPPSKVYFDKNELSNNRALQVIWWEWAGYSFGNSLLQTGVNMNRTFEKSIKDKLLNTRYIDAISHEESQILSELKLLQKQEKDHFVAYASSLFLFAKTALEHNIKDVKFKSVISIGEKLLPQFRESIEKAFSCQVFDTYGASEGFLIASQCTEGKYHIMTPHVFVEILNDFDQEVKEGEMGRVVLTGLDNFTTPLIRYEVGDLAVKGSSEKCACGLELPVLGEIIGRQTEFLLTNSGKYITVQSVVRIMKQFSEIDQFKVIQSDQNQFLLQYVSPKNKLDVQEAGILQAFEKVFGQEMNFTFEKVASMPKAKSGKFQLIENNYKPI